MMYMLRPNQNGRGHYGRKSFSAYSTTRQWLELIAIGVAIIILFIGSGVIVWASLVPIPSINSFQNRQVAQSTKIYDRTGNIVLYDVHGNMRRTSVSSDAISPYIQHATIAIEDSTFYQNAGFRPLSFLRATLVNIFTRSYAQGGSTITQQVVKNALLTQNKTILRKIEEIILAIRLTNTYSKDQILNTYLNEAPYGGTIYGVQEASQYFFGVDAKNIDLAQAAYIAAIPQAPTHFSPYGGNRTALDTRKNLVLQRMLDLGYITPDEYTQAKDEHVEFKSEAEAGIKAPHFVFYILQYLENKYGADEVQNGGLRVVTSLDYDLQQKAENVTQQYALRNAQQFNASNAAMVATDPKTGQILAMVGSRNYFDTQIDGMVNVATRSRQPGSSFKPFVYATAFEKGYTPSTVVYDIPTQFSTACSPQDVFNDNDPCYSPQNFDQKFAGPITFRDAIAQSKNIPSVKVLYLSGIKDSVNTAKQMGITTLGDPSRYGLTLVLGGGEVNLLDETSAYDVFANDGIKNPVTGVLQVQDNNGNFLEKYQDQSVRVLDANIARTINDVLSDDNARAPEFGVRGILYFPGYNVADKTGTTNDYRDVWVLGYTPSISLGAWAGNNDNTPMVKKIAAFIVAPMWHDVMAYALKKYPSDSFPAPSPDASSSLPPVLQGNWNTNPSKGLHELLYWVQRDNPRSGQPSNPWSDPQFSYWETSLQIWLQQQAASSSPQLQQPTSTIPQTH